MVDIIAIIAYFIFLGGFVFTAVAIFAYVAELITTIWHFVTNQMNKGHIWPLGILGLVLMFISLLIFSLLGLVVTKG